MAIIPFFKTTFGAEEKKAINDCIDSGWVVMGKKTQEFEEKFAEYVGAKYAVFVDSGTSALFLALKWWDLEKGTRIGIPSLTFVSDPEVIINTEHIPVFLDIDKKDFCLSYNTVLNAYKTEKIDRAIPVHLTGNESKAIGCIYDSAHRIEKDEFKDKIGYIWCYSFYATKNMSTVQGGMIVCDRPDVYAWLKKARDHGISKGTLERYTEKTPTYSVDFVGYRMKADDLRAVIGLEQLKKLPQMTARRNEIVQRYNSRFGLDRTGNHLYPILVSNREKFFDAMAIAEIQCSVHFKPLHLMPAFKKYAENVSLPNTEYLGERLVSLPLFPDMTNEQVDYVADKVLETGLLINE